MGCIEKDMDGGRSKMRMGTAAVKACLWAVLLAGCQSWEVRAPLVGGYGASEERCASGYRDACWEVGELHRLRHEPGKAAPFYEKACSLGHTAACGAVGRAYARGEGVPRDAGRGARTLVEACDRGDSAACDEVGQLYRDGVGVDVDPDRAAKMFGVACDRRSEAGCLHLGEAVLRGAGIEKDVARGIDLMQGACDNGTAEACHTLGSTYRAAAVVERAAVRAAALHARACERGSDRACESCRAAVSGGISATCRARPKPPPKDVAPEPVDGNAAGFAHLSLRFQQYDVRGTDSDGRIRSLGVALGGQATGTFEKGYTVTGQMFGALGGGGGQVDGLFNGGVDVGARYAPGGSHGPFLRLGLGGSVVGSEKLHRSYFELPRAQLGWQILTDRYLVEIAARGSVALTGRYQAGAALARSYGARMTWGGAVLFQWSPFRLEGAYMRTEGGSVGVLDEINVGGCVSPFEPIVACMNGSYLRTDGWMAAAPAVAPTGPFPPMEASVIGGTLGLGSIGNGPTRRTRDESRPVAPVD